MKSHPDLKRNTTDTKSNRQISSTKSYHSSVAHPSNHYNHLKQGKHQVHQTVSTTRIPRALIRVAGHSSDLLFHLHLLQIAHGEVLIREAVEMVADAA